ncbi:gluconate 2-dehydrogenase subunit 3 family protein [Porifericola rhodea]|uniref:gluconate 2-dehydrogenase subunit 3 family protein n=1 Tax=Porifericola rhodea TaxID=930972 RepID=UPI00266616A0|nr:gluconate 2-dehydrogenase subunit 3 family protein [Porifericola rhodea]WKN29705.1 gluconate 2-dehydrogenase subunit 3 family protein [Porifericola rhodea]
MDRRTALKRAALFAGGIALIPSCNFSPEREAVALDNLQIDLKHQDLLATILETIIPAGKQGEKSDEPQEPGAEALNLYRFVLVMVDDCEPPEVQQIFTSGLRHISQFAKEKLQMEVEQGEQAQNEKLITSLLNMEVNEEATDKTLEDIQAFLNLSKRYAIQGFMASEYVMTEKFPYKLVPGTFQTCVSTDGLTVM